MIRQFDTYSLLSHNTFGIEAKAARFVEFGSVDELVEFLNGGFAGNSLVIGGGSNLLFVGDFNATVFHSAVTGFDIPSPKNE